MHVRFLRSRLKPTRSITIFSGYGIALNFGESLRDMFGRIGSVISYIFVLTFFALVGPAAAALLEMPDVPTSSTTR